MTKLKLTDAREKCDGLQNKEASFMDNLIFFIDSLVHSTDTSESVDAEKPDPRSEEDWSEETQKLGSLYKIELLTLQNKYRDSLRELCTKHLHKNLPLVYAYLTTANAHERPIEEESDAIINEVKNKAIFNSITYDLESVVTQDFDMKGLTTNDREIVIQLLDKVRDYKDHILEQLDKAYEGVKFRLESYYRNLIKKRKEQLASTIENTGEISPASALTKITNEHHEMLVATREQYEARMTRIEQDHQSILQKLMKAHGLIENTSESAESKGSLVQDPSLKQEASARNDQAKMQDSTKNSKLKIPGLSQREGNNNVAMMKQQAVEGGKLMLKPMPVQQMNSGKKMLKARENNKPIS